VHIHNVFLVALTAADPLGMKDPVLSEKKLAKGDA
jgi:hypothetical protein